MSARARVTKPEVVLFGALVVALGYYLQATPPVPDLAAQVARADVVRRVGETVWWLGWFGGLHLPTYSAVTPELMAHLGVPVTGAAATAVAVLAMRRLLATSARPRLGTAAFLATAVANLLDGRVTFAVSLATGLWCLVLVTSGVSRPRLVGGAMLAVLTCLASPLGGLFLAFAVSTVVLVSRRRQRLALRRLLPPLVLPPATMTVLLWLFPGIGQMPFQVVDFLPAAAITVAVAVCCPEPFVRRGAVLYLGLQSCFLIYPAAVGINIIRLAWVFAVPLLVAYGRLPRRAMVAAVALATLLPGVDLVNQLRAADDTSAHADFYRPLVAALAADLAARPGARGQRVEVLDSRNHWASVYVARRFRLARGWERQADKLYNPLFYGRDRLDAASYRRWLDNLAVGWVAVPAGPLDYASIDERHLVGTQPGYLVRIWRNSDWTLYRVAGATPLARPATVVNIDDKALTLDVGTVTTVRLAVRWSPYLVVTDGAGGWRGCVGRIGDWTYVRVPAPGRYTVTADFDGTLRRGGADC